MSNSSPAPVKTPNDSASQTPTKLRRPPRPNYVAIHARPLPLTIHPLPTLTLQNPLSLLHILHICFNPLLSYFLPSLTLSSHKAHSYRAYFDDFTNSVHVTDPATVRALWENGFFGKGSLSRSEPEWLALQRKKLGALVDTSAEITRKRREERREAKRERAHKELQELEEQLRREREGVNGTEGGVMAGSEKGAAGADTGLAGPGEETQASAGNGEILNTAMKEKQKEITSAISEITSQTSPQRPSTDDEALPSEPTPVEQHIVNQEHLQLSLSEAFFLHYALGVLTIFASSSANPSTPRKPLNTTQLLHLFRQTSYFPALSPDAHRLRPDDPFLVSYVVYHHFRSLGWVVRSGIKFAVDFLLYYRGPAFSHAEFAVVILPSYSHPWWSSEKGKGYLQEAKPDGIKSKDWYWLHTVGRVQAQVRKSLVLVYVEVPPPFDEGNGGDDEDVDVAGLLRKYRVSEFVMRRWSPNRNR